MDTGQPFTEAIISQGVKIPITVVSNEGAQTQFVPADLALTVKPYVSQRDCAIAMDINVTKNEADFVNTGARGDPTILSKEAKTRILVGDGETTVLGGIYAFKSGLDMRAEIKMHGESLKQLGSSFQSEVQPIVVDIEGRTLELKGSAEEQYAEWRRLLREMYENETGLPATASTEAVKPAPGRR